MKPTNKPIASPEVVLREEFDDWAVLFHPLTGEAVGAGPVGVVIWKMLDGQRTLEEIAAEVTAQCEDAPAPASVLEDTVAFVKDLERRLFVLVEPEDQP
jgi:SynChlorMet cassette protein ScmD